LWEAAEMKIPFKFLLHNDYYFDETVDIILDSAGVEDDQERQRLTSLLQQDGDPFYEVSFSCLLDTDTGKITVEDIKL
jgi:hypothetical protein